ncbi:hypothetical protein [Komagataeibacter xylinus]|uniref:hypothetical protein n=1 Tax=Komagataeibacter xylinus TaxID=28448 RepID=UPI000FDF68D1|nr:hypothetical protein [Komagataeibacter xylinus]AZV37601.1 hypothetical protein CXP35_00880 [Komagataeibacter xylinus]
MTEMTDSGTCLIGHALDFVIPDFIMIPCLLPAKPHNAIHETFKLHDAASGSAAFLVTITEHHRAISGYPSALITVRRIYFEYLFTIHIIPDK